MKALEFIGTRSTEYHGYNASEPAHDLKGGREERESFDELVSQKGSDFVEDLATDDRMPPEHPLFAGVNEANPVPFGEGRLGLGLTELPHRLSSSHKQSDISDDPAPDTSVSAVVGPAVPEVDTRGDQSLLYGSVVTRYSAVNREGSKALSTDVIVEFDQVGLARGVRQEASVSDAPALEPLPQESPGLRDDDHADVTYSGDTAGPEAVSANRLEAVYVRASTASPVEMPVSSAPGLGDATEPTWRAPSCGKAPRDVPTPNDQVLRGPEFKAGEPAQRGRFDTLTTSVVSGKREENPRVLVGPSRLMDLSDRAQVPSGESASAIPNLTMELPVGSLPTKFELAPLSSRNSNVSFAQNRKPVFHESAVLLARVLVDRLAEPPQVSNSADGVRRVSIQREQRSDEQHSKFGSQLAHDRVERADSLVQTSLAGWDRPVASGSSAPASSVATSGARPALIDGRAPSAVAWTNLTPPGLLKQHSETTYQVRATDDMLARRSLPAQYLRNEVSAGQHNLSTPTNSRQDNEQVDPVLELSVANDFDRNATSSADTVSVTLITQVAASIREALLVNPATVAAPSTAIYAPDLDSNRPGVQQLSVEIEIADLGHISVSLGRRGDQLAIELSTEKKEIADIIGSGISDLNEVLRREGIDVQSITVQAAQPQHDDQSKSSMTHQSSFSQARDNSQSSQDRKKENASAHERRQDNADLELRPGGHASSNETMPPRRNGRTLII